jgi:hypothetical protein
MKFFLTSLLLVFIISVQSQNKETGWLTLKGKNYSIKYPNNWEPDQSGQSGTIFILMSVLEVAEDLFRENINLITQDLTGKNMDLKKFAELSTEQIKTLMPNSKIIESEWVKTKSGEYHKIIYTGDQSNFHLKFEQYYWVINNHSYILIFTAEESKFAKYKETAEKIMDSFVIKK